MNEGEKGDLGGNQIGQNVILDAVNVDFRRIGSR
jgi:hypothetical protein